MQLILEGRPLRIFPLQHNKRPACPEWPKAATADPEEADKLFRLYPGPLIGVPTGEVNGFDVLDVDAYKPTAALWHRENMGRIPPTRMHETKNGGHHYLFQHVTGLGCSARLLAHGVEVKADGGYVVWWVEKGFGFVDAPIAPWPEWSLAKLQNRTREDDDAALREALAQIEVRGADEDWVDEMRVDPGSPEARHALASLTKDVGDLASARPGERNIVLNAVAFSMGQQVINGWITLTKTCEWLISGAEKCKLIRDDGRQSVERTILSGLAAGFKQPYPPLRYRK